MDFFVDTVAETFLVFEAATGNLFDLDHYPIFGSVVGNQHDIVSALATFPVRLDDVIVANYRKKSQNV